MFKNQHVCTLIEDRESVVIQSINTGLLIDLRRKFRRLSMVYRSHPMTEEYIRSNSAIRTEENRHLLQYYCMVHPFSKLKIYWDYAMAFVYVWVLLITPFILGFPQGAVDLYPVLCVLDLIILLNVQMNFLVGYYDKELNEVILKPKKVARRYFTTYFFPDIISGLPSYLYPLKNIASEHSMTFHMIYFLQMLKLFRLPYVEKTLKMFRIHFRSSPQRNRIINLVLLFIVFVLWCFGIGFGFDALLKRSAGATVVDYHLGPIRGLFYWMKFLFLVGYGRNNWIFTKEPILVVVVIMICAGFCLQMYLLAKIQQLWSKHSTSANKHTYILQQIHRYNEYKALPATTREHILSFFDFKYQKQYFQESEINLLMSKQLRQEILLHAAKSHIQNVEMFMDLPRSVQIDMADNMRSEIFMPNDTVVRAGTPGSSMYFIFTGTLAAYTPNGREICHLKDGDHFGNVGLIFKEKRMVTVVAITICELFKLRRNDFLTIMEPHPVLMDRLMDYALRSILKAKKIAPEKKEPPPPPTDNSPVNP